MDDFKKRYGDRVIGRSEKVKTMIKQVEEEVNHGVSNGLITFEDFSYLYMFLEFNENKKAKKSKRKDSVSEATEAERDSLSENLI